MKRIPVLSILLGIILVLSGCSVLMPFEIIDTDQPGSKIPELDDSYYEDLNYKDQYVLIRPKSMGKIDEILVELGSEEINRWDQIEWARVTVPEGKTVEEFLKTINEHEEIYFAEPVLEYELPWFEIEEDPRIGDPEPPRPLDTNGEIEAALYFLLWGMQHINVEQVWADLTTGNEDVIVAIVDTGVQTDHPEFAGINFLGHFDATTGGTDVTDYHGHGTHVAGTAVADGRGGFIAGVAWDTSVMPIKVMDDEGLIWTSYLIDAMVHMGDYAKDHGASIVANMSIGGRGYSLAFKDAIDYAAGEGVLLVTSAGNAYKRVLSYPSAYNGVLSVAAINARREKADFSTEGWWNSVAAPGVKILSTYPGDGYAFMQGTSMASPHVAGAVGLLLSHLGPMDPVEIINRVQQTATGDEFTEEFGYGILDVYALLTDQVEPRYGKIFVQSDVAYGLVTVFDTDGNMVHFGATGIENTHIFHTVDPGEYEVTLSYNYQIRDRKNVFVELGEETLVELLVYPGK